MASYEMIWQSLLMLGCSNGKFCTTVLASDLEELERPNMLLSNASSNLSTNQGLLKATSDALLIGLLAEWMASRQMSTILYVNL